MVIVISASVMEILWVLRVFFLQKYRAGDTGGAGGGMPPFFSVAKRKRGDKGKKERVSKQKLLKGCHQGRNIIVLGILERLEFENFSVPWPLHFV